MNQQSQTQNLRREANRAFLESLQALGADSPAPPPAVRPPVEGRLHRVATGESPLRPEREKGLGFSPTDLEQAIADIEQYLQQQPG